MRNRNWHADAEIGGLIRIRRKNMGFSQTKLATSLGISFQQLQKYENGTNRVSAARLLEIARVLNCPVTHLLGAEQPLNKEGGTTKLFASPLAVEMLEAFNAISNPTTRLALVELMKQIANNVSDV